MKPGQCTFLAQILLLMVLAGCASPEVRFTCPVSPAIAACSNPALVLKKELDGMIARELLPYSVASIKVVSLKSGSTLYETNPYLLMPAASVQKLFTAAATFTPGP
jgi:D-alanyl-D-alanine carboxypeptidase